MGNRATPAKALILSISSISPSSPVTRSWKRANMARASASDLPLTSSVITEAEAVEMAQPLPSNATSATVPSSTSR